LSLTNPESQSAKANKTWKNQLNLTDEPRNRTQKKEE